jgi:hypothetical protein
VGTMFNHSITHGYTDDGGNVFNSIIKFTGQTEAGYDGTIAANATDFLIDIAFPITGLQSLCIWSDTNLTVKTNSSSSPVQTIALLANVPISWGAGTGATDPITAAVTSLYVTNATANPAKFKVRALST